MHLNDAYRNIFPAKKQGESMPESLSTTPQPYWSALGATLYLGDVRECLRRLPARSVHCAVTSPPYWGLRSYLDKDHSDKSYEIGSEPSPDCGTSGQAQCGTCYVCAMVGVFRDVYRVLRDDGTLFLNLGDTYASGGKSDSRDDWDSAIVGTDNAYGRKRTMNCGDFNVKSGVSSGNLVGIPWRVALALQADGWVLRQDIIWAKPSPMPESVTNRCTKSHEYMFMFTKGMRYYYDAVAIEEPTVVSTSPTKNKRDVWTVAAKSYHGAHFATYPPLLITPCILAGTSECGCCASCSTPYERITTVDRAESRVSGGGNGFGSRDPSAPEAGAQQTANWAEPVGKRTVGWRKVCGCQTDDVVPAVVLDPFVGSGTTVATSVQLGRVGIGIDLSEAYLQDHAIPHIEAAISSEKVVRESTVVVPPDVPPTPRRLR